MEHYGSSHRLYSDPTISHAIYPLLNSQPLHAARRSITVSQPEDLIYQNYSVHQHPLPLDLGPVSTARGQTVSFLLQPLDWLLVLEVDICPMDSTTAKACSVNLKISL
jgi:hypothetical protein